MKHAPKHSARPKATPPQPTSESGSLVWDLKPKKGRDAYKSWLRATFPLLAQLATLYLPKHSLLEIILGKDDLLVLNLVESIKRFKSYAESLSGDNLNETLHSASVAAESISDDSGGQSLPHLLANYDKLFKSAKKDFHRLITTLFELLIEEIKSTAGDLEIDNEITALRNAWELRIAALCAKKPTAQSFTAKDFLSLFQRIAEKLSDPFNPAGKLRGPQSIRRIAEISARCDGSHDKVFSLYLKENASGRRKATKCALKDWTKDCTTADLGDSRESRYGGRGKPKQTLLKVFTGSPKDDPLYIGITNGDGYVEYALEGNVYRIKQAKAIAYIDLLIEANKKRENGWLETPIHTTRTGKTYSGKEALNFVFMGKDNGKSNSSYKSGSLFAKHCLESDDNPPSVHEYRVRICLKK